MASVLKVIWESVPGAHKWDYGGAGPATVSAYATPWCSLLFTVSWWSLMSIRCAAILEVTGHVLRVRCFSCSVSFNPYKNTMAVGCFPYVIWQEGFLKSRSNLENQITWLMDSESGVLCRQSGSQSEFLRTPAASWSHQARKASLNVHWASIPGRSERKSNVRGPARGRVSLKVSQQEKSCGLFALLNSF